MLKVLFGIFFLLLGLAIIGMITTSILSAFPVGMAHDMVASIMNFTFSFIDGSVLVLLFLMCIIELIVAYENPSKLTALVGVIELFMIGYINATFVGMLPALTALNIATTMPLTYALFSGGALIFILYFLIIMVIIFNLRKEDINDNK